MTTFKDEKYKSDIQGELRLNDVNVLLNDLKIASNSGKAF